MLTPSPNGARWPEPQPLANPGRFSDPAAVLAPNRVAVLSAASSSSGLFRFASSVDDPSQTTRRHPGPSVSTNQGLVLTCTVAARSAGAPAVTASEKATSGSRRALPRARGD